MCQIGFSAETKQRICVFRVVLGISGDLLPYPVLIEMYIFIMAKKILVFIHLDQHPYTNTLHCKAV